MTEQMFPKGLRADTDDLGQCLVVTIDSGIYSETPAGLYYKRSLVNDWGLTSNKT